MATMKTAVVEFLAHADRNGIKRLYEVFPSWLQHKYPGIYSTSKGIAALRGCLHKNDLAYRKLNPKSKKLEKEKRINAYRLIFKEARGDVMCGHCAAPVIAHYSRSTPPNMREVGISDARYCCRDCALQADDRQTRRRATCMARYGVDAVSKTKEWKRKVRNSFEQRYGEGITNPSHVPAVVKKILEARYGRKEELIGGKLFAYQGYESVLVRYLVERLGIPANKITTNQKLVGFFPYKHLGKQHNYFPDAKFIYKGKSRYAEVKSISTLAGTRAIALRVLAKADAMWEADLSYTVVLCSNRKILATATNREALIELIKKHRRRW